MAVSHALVLFCRVDGRSGFVVLVMAFLMWWSMVGCVILVVSVTFWFVSYCLLYTSLFAAGPHFLSAPGCLFFFPAIRLHDRILVFSCRGFYSRGPLSLEGTNLF